MKNLKQMLFISTIIILSSKIFKYIIIKTIFVPIYFLYCFSLMYITINY